MAGFWGTRKKEREQLDAQDADLARRARSALVAADERIRTTTDELAFAEAELGIQPTKDLRDALAAVTHHLGEAFHLNQLNHDEIPDTAEELRTRNARILQLCEWADELLDDRTGALAEPIARARRAPEILASVRRDAAALRARIPHIRETIGRLAARYSADALAQVDANPSEAEQLIGFAEHSASVAERRREAGQREQANLALEASIESIRRAEALVDAVENYEIEALRAESTLAAIIDDSRGDLIAVRTAPQAPTVLAAAAALDAALRSLPAAGVNTDPFAHLTRLREANTALDSAIAAERERAARPVIPPEQVRNAIDDADRQLAIVKDVIAGHRGWIGADARTRVAEADRTRTDLDAFLGQRASTLAQPILEEQREHALALARRVAFLANEGLQLAQRDIDSSRPPGGPGSWGGPGQGQGQGGNMLGGILGGLVIGSILDGIFD
ncbi:hypothetical protein [Microbacterium ulmi]|uniref:Uncharacterized protein n=1 Tax=Microbacterium ulmi TaxID=179095 RepID=A0A7Y2M1W2_9MICO|nr:hypothetical protein [Microbacterium ulmi]NII70403.1 hypothetical protein [Microbacterium ulmi]NNH04995.1 hypothetical protein [Microbacterium ulmi]